MATTVLNGWKMGWAEAERSVEIKGYGGSLGLVLDDSVPFARVQQDLRRLVQEHSIHRFFKGSPIRLRPGRPVTSEEFDSLQSILKEGDLQLLPPEPTAPPAVPEPPPLPLQAQLSLPTLEVPAEVVEVEVPVVEEEDPLAGLQTEAGLIVAQTLRSGQKVHTQESVVLFGDLNAGAEIVSEGNVMVLGAVRGVVHAGASGDLSAVVFALRLAPTQLRIGGLYARPPAEEASPYLLGPEKAFVENGQIVIESPPYEMSELQALIQGARRHENKKRGMGRSGLPLITLGTLKL